MTVRGWLMIGGEEAARTLPTSAALIGPNVMPYVPDASTVDVGRWILWAPTLDHLQAPICMVCVEVPL